MSTTYNQEKLAEAIKAFGKERLEEYYKRFPEGRLAQKKNSDRLGFFFILSSMCDADRDYLSITSSHIWEYMSSDSITYLEPPRPLRKEGNGHTESDVFNAWLMGRNFLHNEQKGLPSLHYTGWYTSTFPTATAPTEEVHEVKGYIDTKNPEKSHIISNTITEEPRKGDIKDHEYKGEKFYTMVKQSKSTASCQSYNTNDEPLQYSDILDIAQQTDFSTSDYSSLIRESCLMATAVHLEKSSQSPEPQEPPSPQPQPSFTREEMLTEAERELIQMCIQCAKDADKIQYGIANHLNETLKKFTCQPLPSRLDLLIKWWGEQERPSEITFKGEAMASQPTPYPTQWDKYYRRGTSEWISLEGVV